MDILQLLENAILSPDPTQRTQAEIELNEAANNHFPQYISLLIEALNNNDAKTEVRQLAGIGLKNQLVSKDPRTKLAQQDRWLKLDIDLKTKIKNQAVLGLNSDIQKVASTAAQLVAAIADIELPRGEWPELIPIIIQNTKSENPENVKRASQLAIGYICETSDHTNPNILSQASGILIAIIQGVQSNEPSTNVRITALNALVNSLEFIKFNFENEGERNYIMQVVCEATQADNSELQASAFGCLARIMSLYYRFMSLYMEKALYGLTVSGMQSSDEKVACMAVEFWSTVCEEELEIALQRHDLGLDPLQNATSPDLVTFNFALIASSEVLPTLLTLLTRQNEDPEDDDWSVAMAAGACLQLYAQNIGAYVVDPTINFVSTNITKDNWRSREAAVMAFGSILDGPNHDQLKNTIKDALSPILALINDPNLQVKETVAWCLGRIADMVVDAIDIETQLPQLLEALVKGLQDHPKVSTNCCWTLMNLVEQLCSEQDQETNVMSPYYPTIIPVLMQVSGRPDNENSSRASAYEALSTFVTYSALDTMGIVQNIASEILSRLESTIELQSQVSTTEDKGNLEELQTNILSLLTNVIRKLGSNVINAADNLMDRFIKLLNAQEPNSVIEEDLFIAISALASAIGDGFMKYLEAFLPYLTRALENVDSPTCFTAIGLVGDLAQSLGLQITEYLNGLMTILGNNLSNPDIKRELRPAIVSAFGDVAAAIGTKFAPYLEYVMNICTEAANIEPQDNSLETMDYVLGVQEAVLDCFVGITAGFSDQPQTLYPVVGTILQFLQKISQDSTLSNNESVARSATGLIGDLAAMYPQGQFKQYFENDWVTEFIKKTRSNVMFEEKTKDAARWARDQQKRQQQIPSPMG
ncbi:kap95 [Candida pseudojiufengensis]|uniref:kap95 n=1 Tax=Candida pseudojiufengensis TaxID=497109 RepID=UPI002224B668|nr:kap95 [Candida pseudojiufengensis]KAI5959568.1 kap95 [Candida pseudojiufengensis]